jgi:VCBS repeat-containing protein
MDSGDTVTLAAPTKPSWLSFDTRTGVLSGTPANRNVGEHSIVLSATDVAGAVTTQNFTISVSNINDAPTVINAIADQVTTEDSAFSYQFDSDVFADVDVGDSFTYTATLSDGSALPSWLSFNVDTHTFSGTPLNANVGVVTVKVTATDGGSATGSDTFNIKVTNTNDAPSITSTEVTSVNEDTAYSYTLKASDVDSGDTVTLASTTIPSWLSFNSGTGVLSGTPKNSNLGDHSVVLSATDVAGAVTTQAFTISVTSTLETNGDYDLAHDGDKYFIIDGNGNKLGLNYSDKPVGPNKWDGWNATQVEGSSNGGFEVFWSHRDGDNWVWKTDTSGNFRSSINRPIAENETIFKVDLDGDDHIGIPPPTILETNGDYNLAQVSDNYYIIDGNGNKLGLTYLGKFVGPNKWAGWNATQVEESSSSGFEVFWSHSDGNTRVWKTDTSGNFRSSINRPIAEN